MKQTLHNAVEAFYHRHTAPGRGSGMIKVVIKSYTGEGVSHPNAAMLFASSNPSISPRR